MTDPATEQRLHGEPFTVGAHQSFLLDDPDLVFWVERGHLDIFAVELMDEERISRRPFVARIPAGATCFGVQRLVGPKGTLGLFSLLAVPAMGTTVIRGKRTDVVSEENFDLDAMIWIDEWVLRLSEFMVRGGRPPPRDALLLDADPNVSYPAGSSVSAHHSDVIWVSSNRPMRFIGRGELVVEAVGHLTPLSERTWFELDEDCEISAVHTPAAAVTGQLWPAFDRFSALALEYAALVWLEKIESGGERTHEKHAAHRRSGVQVFRNLGRVLGTAQAREAAVPGARTPLQTVAGIVAGSVGATLDIPREREDDPNPITAIEAVTRSSGIRLRKITLTTGWWRRDGPSFVGSTRKEKRLLALLSDGRGTYRAVDPSAGTTFDVGAREAAEIAPGAMMFHPSFPERIDSGLAALKYSLRGRGRDIAILGIMGVLTALLALLIPVLSGDLLAEVIPRVDTPMWIAYLAALFLAAFGTMMFDIVRALALLRIEGRIDENLQAAVWSRLLSLPAPFFRKFTAGDLADRANGISMIRVILTGATANAVIGGIFSIFSYALLFYYSWRLALCAGALVLVLIGMTWFFAHGAMKHHRAAFTAQGLIDGFVFQMLTGLTKLRMANAEADALARWAERYAEQKRETLSARRWMASQIAFNSLFTPLCLLTIFALIWYMLIGGGAQESFDLADFLSFNAAFGQFAGAMTGLTSACATVVSVIPLFERVQPIIEAQPETAGGGADPGDMTGEIEFANVTFRYLPEVPNAVERVSFHIRPGDFVAFVGPSGSGKSTIYRLLLGFDRPDSGAVFLDGHDISTLDMPAIRSRMGVVLQNSRLAASSIFNNIASSSPLTMEEAWEAARAAGLDADIESMPMGMHTVLPEGGGGLSGGQRQRLLIARALARKPRIMLFDEATSALDNRTQAIVQASLKKFSVTRVVIAHRLTTVQDADRIFVLEAGRIVETGRYDDLMQREGAFATLARRQII